MTRMIGRRTSMAMAGATGALSKDRGGQHAGARRGNEGRGNSGRDGGRPSQEAPSAMADQRNSNCECSAVRSFIAATRGCWLYQAWERR